MDKPYWIAQLLLWFHEVVHISQSLFWLIREQFCYNGFWLVLIFFFSFSTIISSDCETSSVALVTRAGASVSIRSLRKVQILFTFAIAAKLFSHYFLYSQQKWNEIYRTAATTFKQWFEFRSNFRIRILAIWIQTDFFLYFVIEKDYNTQGNRNHCLFIDCNCCFKGLLCLQKCFLDKCQRGRKSYSRDGKKKFFTGSQSTCVCH